MGTTPLSFLRKIHGKLQFRKKKNLWIVMSVYALKEYGIEKIFIFAIFITRFWPIYSIACEILSRILQ